MARPRPLPPLALPRAVGAAPLFERLWAKVRIEGEHWLWEGATSGTGTPTIAAGAPSRKSLAVHRLIWTWAYGPLAEGVEVTQRCGLRRCVRPTHLRATTMRERRDRRRRPRRAPPRRGRHGVARLTPMAPRPCARGHLPDPATLAYTAAGNRVCGECDPERHARERARMAAAAAKPRPAAGGQKLSDAAVRELRRRRAAGETQASLGAAFGVSQSLVSRVLRGVQWAHVGEA